MKKISRNLLLTSSVLVTPLIVAPIVSCSNNEILPDGEVCVSYTHMTLPRNREV